MMKKIFYAFAAVAAALTSCTMERLVTLDHPVSVDMEPDPVTREIPVQFFDLKGATCDAASLTSYINWDADVLLFASGYDRAEWLTETLALAGYEYSVITSEKDDLCLAAAISIPAEIKTVVLSDCTSPYVVLGNNRILLSALSGEGEAELLDETYVPYSEYGWLYAVRLEAESSVFKKAAFTDCYKAQWGEQFIWEGRTNFLYASPGTWNSVRRLVTGRFAGIPSPVYSFNIVSEEEAI